MATYTEIRNNAGDGVFRKKVETAAWRAAQLIMDEGDTEAPFDQTAGKHELRLKLALDVIDSVKDGAAKLHYYVMVKNHTANMDTILASSDDTIQDAVNAAIDPLATAYIE